MLHIFQKECLEAFEDKNLKIASFIQACRNSFDVLDSGVHYIHDNVGVWRSVFLFTQ